MFHILGHDPHEDQEKGIDPSFNRTVLGPFTDRQGGTIPIHQRDNRYTQTKEKKGIHRMTGLKPFKELNNIVTLQDLIGKSTLNGRKDGP